MGETTIEASVPALVLVVPKSIGASFDHPEYEEEHEGSVFVGLKFVIIFYAVLAAGIATGWLIYHLF